ncbi:conserved hypothetical protein [Ricinus communis]|uniref:Uncharacterized protein n=1 Tax=Ricinus communis TaxID=3988 RepID=B9RTW3_RICCO|nr:conserved hypothetical protein [Ricinus communis]
MRVVEDCVRRRKRMNPQTKLNAIRSGIVVIGALAFGYLTFEIGFKPFLERAQQQQHYHQRQLQEQETAHQENTLTHDSHGCYMNMIDGDTQENRQEEDEQNWWENWERRRRMAVAQVLCYVVYAIYILRLYYDVQCNESEMSRKDKKRKARTWEKKFLSIKESINDVIEAIKEGNAIIDRARQHVYSEREVYAELVKIGLERHLRYTAYTFLTQDPVRVRAFFGYPVNERKDFLLQMMYGPQDP